MSPALYIHIPFCIRKCGYCDFLSMNADDSTINEYFNALYKQIEIESQNINDGVSSIYIGGGTPSFVNEKYIYSLMNRLYQSFKIDDDAEISMEANPNSSYDIEKFRVYKAAGINRLSFGVQSTNDRLLAILKRSHSYDDFLRSLDIARMVGFTNINADLIYSVPTQKLSDFTDSLKKLIGLNLEHISAYSLIIEPNTLFYEKYHINDESRKKGEASGALCSENEDLEMMWMARDILEANGYIRYEISNYAKKGYECKHNLGYWKRSDYFGFGIGAASLLDGERFSVIRDIREYIDYFGDKPKSTPQIYEDRYRLSKADEIAEAMMLGLRMVNGIDIADVNKRYDTDILRLFKNEIDKNLKLKLLQIVDNRLFLTDRGIELANTVMSDFF